MDGTQSGHNNDRNSVFVRFRLLLSVAAKDLLRRSFVYVSCPQSLPWDNPLKAEITSSNLVRATIEFYGPFGVRFRLRRVGSGVPEGPDPPLNNPWNKTSRQCKDGIASHRVAGASSRTKPQVAASSGIWLLQERRFHPYIDAKFFH